MPPMQVMQHIRAKGRLCARDVLTQNTALPKEKPSATANGGDQFLEAWPRTDDAFAVMRQQSQSFARGDGVIGKGSIEGGEIDEPSRPRDVIEPACPLPVDQANAIEAVHLTDEHMFREQVGMKKPRFVHARQFGAE